MDLSSEDNFRINVLLANKPQAIRIDESKLVVYGLSERGEARVPLNPTGHPEQYLRKVRELISGHILGSPGGYPIYLRRWTRMGQMGGESLEQLLMLGEPEAVVAAVCSPGLTDELARRAWWAMEDAESARRMLANPAIAAGTMGKVLGEYLVELLPFETESDKMMESVRLVLQTGLLDEERRLDLWKKAVRRQAYLVGFLQTSPDDIPEPAPARDESRAWASALAAQAQLGNSCAALLVRVLASPGQTFLRTVVAVLAKPSTQEVVHTTLDVLRNYFSPLRPEGDPDLTLDEVIAEARVFSSPQQAPATVRACLEIAPSLGADIAAMRVLSGVGYGIVRPVLRDTTVIGSLMRRKLAPVLEPLLERVEVLRGGRRRREVVGAVGGGAPDVDTDQ